MNKKAIFLYLVIGKLFFFTLIFLSTSFLQLDYNFFVLPDLVRYSDSENLKNIFSLGEWVPNAGFMSIAFLINKIKSFEFLKLIIYGFISLNIVSLSQLIILNLVFKEAKFTNSKLNKISIFLSITNFYIILYSLKVSTDIYGCLGIAILISILLRLRNKESCLNLFLYFLIICLFRNQLIVSLPFLLLTKLPNQLMRDIKKINRIKKFIIFSLSSSIIFTLFFQFFGYFNAYLEHQSKFGLFSLTSGKDFEITFSFLKNLAIFFANKLLFLFSAREAVSLSGNLLAGTGELSFFELKAWLINLIPQFYLLLVNLLGLVSIFRCFNIQFRNAFLFSLIPLIPVLSGPSHHRYFLPYSIITTACLPYLFALKTKKISSNKE